MPFGSISATTTFHRLMDEILSGLHEFAVAYLDDILIHSLTQFRACLLPLSLSISERVDDRIVLHIESITDAYSQYLC